MFGFFCLALADWLARRTPGAIECHPTCSSRSHTHTLARDAARLFLHACEANSDNNVRKKYLRASESCQSVWLSGRAIVSRPGREGLPTAKRRSPRGPSVPALVWWKRQTHARTPIGRNRRVSAIFASAVFVFIPFFPKMSRSRGSATIRHWFVKSNTKFPWEKKFFLLLEGKLSGKTRYCTS